ncbi:DeoR family transcriptional regulator [Streptomyces umbrinus]|uniref:substrate-binding domain-containing protein n=1 Tax=Streptomyces umbrinus TaxID=67370 RepID=UPI00167AAC33|nr:substrate-binding domain-containing protein [Streptomyces umbrinus]GHB83301.1 DeoR family transcriptional regulator [Streptomyces umbrinus]
MREPVDARRQRILAAVQERGTARVRDLAAELQVSGVTIRRDIEELTREGKLRRGHGVVRSTLPAQELPEGGGGDGATVAVVVPERHSYLYEALHGARAVFDTAGMRVALHIAPPGPGTERPQVERALADGASGVLLAPRWRSSDVEQADYDWLATLEVPTALMERRPLKGSALHALDSVCSDHWFGAHLAVEHLVRLGHRRLVFATRDDSPTARTVHAALSEIADAHPLVEDWAWTLSSSRGGMDRGPGDVTDLASTLRKVGATAAVLHSDVDALMLVQRLAEDGVRVPEDFSVVAYDDVVAGLGSPPLTAVSPPKGEVGRVAAQLLLRRVDGSDRGGAHSVQRIELLPTLTVRGSTHPAP